MVTFYTKHDNNLQKASDNITEVMTSPHPLRLYFRCVARVT